MSQFGAQFHGRSGRTLNGSGKIKKNNRDKRRHEMGGYFVATKLGESNSSKNVRVRGGSRRSKMQYAGFANLLEGKSYKKVKITGVVESKDNRNFARMNIITKGTVILTDAGRAVVVNRPGKEGFINAKKL
ncbi:MAG: 30S ribosomal protein S8e [Candidatus Micrarchaeota archaeon]|nr:30S ribosomal protein S8e [Candidatus Micrarchaeota archaeon]MDE1824566.1 30S ribosomal protein S8e [Candidatus Micrarchaeota archaeon]MDE1849641.1 30S ribosomal protein S8e [Candidatus Micrarchaeota archaeon]